MTRTISVSTSELRGRPSSPFPLHDFGIDRAEAARIIESIGLPTLGRSTCGWTPSPRRNQPDEAMIRHLLLGPLENRLRALGEELGLRGQTHRIVALAMEVAQQGLRWPIEAGTRVVSIDGRHQGVVVGVKPVRFVEDWQKPETARREGRGERFVRNDLGQQEALVWTVDPSSRTPGISQGRLSDWEQASN
jgi:hypothetical protein